MASAILDNLGIQIKEIGDFEIVRKLGEGGMGSVFLARQKSLDRQVALKVIAPSFSDNADFIARFQREARATGNLNHPNIVQGIDVARDAKTGLWHFAMEFVNGPSVSKLLKDGPLSEERALKITLQVARALDYAGKRGFVHRDIKPDNILIAASGEAKLADLGLAKRTGEDASLTQTGFAVGTPHYISPEQTRGDKDIDGRADIYSLGATLFHLTTGRPPFDGPTAAVIMVKHLNDEPPTARQINPKVSEGCSKLISKMMRKDRAQRFKTAAELIERIEGVLAGEDLLASEPAREPIRKRGDQGESRTGVKRSRKNSNALLYAGIAAAVAGVAVATAIAAFSGTPPAAPESKPQARQAEPQKPELPNAATLTPPPAQPVVPAAAVPAAPPVAPAAAPIPAPVIPAPELAALEEKARKVWEALHITGAPPANPQAAGLQIRVLDEYGKVFGRTKFAASIADKIRDARAQAQNVVGVAAGIFVGRAQGSDWIDFKPDGAPAPEHLAIDTRNQELVGVVSKLVTYRRLKVQWKDRNGAKLVSSVELLPVPAEGSEGVTVGRVVASDLNGQWGLRYLDIQTDAGELHRFAPNNHGRDPNFPEMISRAKIGEKIKVSWFWELRPRLVKLEPAE